MNNTHASIAALVVSSVFPSMAVAADAQAIAGTYMYLSASQTNAAGQKVDIFGPNPNGMLMLGADGRYVIAVVKAGLPKFASNTRMKATPEEMRAVVEGSLAHFGRYTVQGDSINFHIEHATFPNWDGATQKRTFRLEGDLLKYTVPASSTGGGSAEVVLRRMK